MLKRNRWIEIDMVMGMDSGDCLLKNNKASKLIRIQ